MQHEAFHRYSEVVRTACRAVTPTSLRPEAFFVARFGVLTLAYSGWPESLAGLKTVLAAALPSVPAENPGSRWPKTTLAALRDGERLSEEDVVQLREATAEATTCLFRNPGPIPVDFLSVVELGDRAMERVGRVESIRLEGERDAGTVARASRVAVNAVLAQWKREGLSRYVPDLMAEGHRESHYRGGLHEVSLLVHIGDGIPCTQPFRDAVEARLPGRYAWLQPAAYHVTLRTLGRLGPDGDFGAPAPSAQNA